MHTTVLEDYVSTLYKNIGIFTPEDINIKKISKSLNILLTYSEFDSVMTTIKSVTCINIDSRLSEYEQREVFFHELCHSLRHVGNQMNLPKSFIEYQEWDAQRFTLYATMPYHLVENRHWENPIALQKVFKVPYHLCEKRFNQLINRYQILSIG
ncbi:ImmA/IrrE family metallo-endopeptidase [Bacillus sp. AFS017336]|uniref:ImmA/IrrE family metallo-endopeptidase n=1 Tax=Bacillus sp. AFS017336 TaxID=2033489 RepID=UPI000BEF467E|nr:ImmA/IrrE family metallo-endopeptidase [Bacillus sp. AFS017336]PEL12699.1 peptidase [Bacillus sp. AFS017336]